MSVSNKATSYVIVGSQAAISGSQAVISPSGHRHRPVLVTPVLPPKPTIDKLLLKAVMKGKPKESKMFTLRNLDPNRIVSCKDLMREIQVQLSEDMTGSTFDVGFIQGNSAVSIRSNKDLVEIWDLVQKGKNIVLWCDGIVLAKENRKENRKRSARVDSDDDSEIEQKRRSKKKKKDDSVIEDQVEEIVQKLKAKHGTTTYTQMQYRIWSEMIVGGIHVSQNEHPETTMFARCGSAVSAKKRSSSNVVKAIADALSPKQNSGSNAGA